MSSSDLAGPLTREELAVELVEIFDDLPVESINELLAKNVPLEVLHFFAAHADEFADAHGIEGRARKRLPNLMVLGYLLHVVEERLLPDDGNA